MPEAGIISWFIDQGEVINITHPYDEASFRRHALVAVVLGAHTIEMDEG